MAEITELTNSTRLIDSVDIINGNFNNLNDGKQDAISDLDTIRNNASTGAGLATQVETNKSNIASLSSGKADKSTTYTKTEADELYSGKANLASPALTGTPTSTTPATTDNSTKIATTAFCKAVTNKTVTLNSTYATRGDVSCSINNKIATVCVSSLMLNSVPEGAVTIASNLPKSNNSIIEFLLYKYNSSTGYRFAINSSGTLASYYNTVPAGNYFGSISYITSDN